MNMKLGTEENIHLEWKMKKLWEPLDIFSRFSGALCEHRAASLLSPGFLLLPGTGTSLALKGHMQGKVPEASPCFIIMFILRSLPCRGIPQRPLHTEKAVHEFLHEVQAENMRPLLGFPWRLTWSFNGSISGNRNPFS
jgi:hypothetical protein